MSDDQIRSESSVRANRDPHTGAEYLLTEIYTGRTTGMH